MKSITMHEPAGPTSLRSGSRTTHGHSIDFQCRLANPDRHALTILATGADPAIELQVITDHADSRQNLRAAANQGSPLHRPSDSAIFDQVGFTGGKHELAGCNIDLATAKVNRIEALFHGANDLLRIMRTCKHVRVRHAWHWQMRIGFSPAITG